MYRDIKYIGDISTDVPKPDLNFEHLAQDPKF